MNELVLNARKGRVEKIDSALAGIFVKENHRQGLARPGKRLRSFGLFINDELLAVAMFCNPRTAGMQKRYTTELFRLAFKKGVRIRGGASKLIKYFLNTGPWDLFTYQDTSGEGTSVYEHAGMTLISKFSPTKKVLVKNGLTFETAEDNHKDWFSMELASKRGPDSLLGVSLGEVHEIVGGEKKRISNIQLFVEQLAYHIEEIPGDRIYEWNNPQINFYTYRVTSVKDENYYIGRRAIHMENPSIEDCQKDKYFGSGGKRLQEWLSAVEEHDLNKEILGIHATWEEVLKAEAQAIGDSYATDPLCMNTFPGGFWSGFTIAGGTVSEKDCALHGLSKFYGNTCMKCMSQKNISTKLCSIHGETKHIGEKCSKCISDNFRSIALCIVHGETTHQGKFCSKCIQEKVNHVGVCSVHGETPFKGETCIKCSRAKAVNVKKCEVHGEAKHQGATCIKCSRAKATTLRTCEVHGESKHQGLSCIKCSRARNTTLKICETHGEAKHQGDTCMKCTMAKRLAKTSA